MINSITFNEGSGYVSARYTENDLPEKPRKPIKTICSPRSPIRDQYDKKLAEYKELLKSYQKEMKVMKKQLGLYKNPEVAKNLIGHKIEFSPNKINLIFGPNGSGKTTILKEIAGHCFIKHDGFPQITRHDIPFMFSSDKPVYDIFIKKFIHNDCSIDWTGNPVYYENFAYRLENARGSFGDLSGGFMDFKDEISWHMNKNRVCAGERAMYVLDKVIGFVQQNRSLESIMKDSYGEISNKDILNRIKSDLSSLPDYNKESPVTLILDEIDKNFSVYNVRKLYKEILPALVDRLGCQLIIVSHSPLVLSDKIYNSDLYNFISMDEGYTMDCRKAIKEWFS